MKTILIIGGSGALGSAIARNLKDENKVIITTDSEEKLEKAVQNTGCEVLVCDITDWGSIEFIVNVVRERHGSIDVLINSAGLYASGKVEDIDPIHAKKVFEVNAIGPLLTIKAVTGLMKESGGVVNLWQVFIFNSLTGS